uniref:4-diphosphocytidyl-2-C-methyl-D-erythritol kinase n=1 Tax=Haematococcus lacustris TaxID=44745 RepID=A0A0H3V8I0_HAELA|nr:4-diphosphocytidyl-2-C-methyl-D-erythritol kinase [Haematococcus lacustris]
MSALNSLSLHSGLLHRAHRGVAQQRQQWCTTQRHRRQGGVISRVAVQCTAAGRLALFSPSKINLFLRVMRRREDGFHDLASLFHVIDLGDDMTFELLPEGADRDQLSCSDPSIPSDDSNLVIKALHLFRRKTQTARFFGVTLQKKVPHGAGLGGGSGNAATTLWAANELMGRPATAAQLLQWSGEIGSDISVFFSLGAAYCTGRGEVVEDVAPPLPLTTPLLLVKPPVGLATPRIFKSLDLSRRSAADPLELLAGMTKAGATGSPLPQALCVHDLEQPAFDNLPELKELKERLASSPVGSSPQDSPGGAEQQRPAAVFMTGSGSTIVSVGCDTPPAFLADPNYKDMFVSPARLIVRQPDQWYVHSGQWKA